MNKEKRPIFRRWHPSFHSKFFMGYSGDSVTFEDLLDFKVIVTSASYLVS
jgi:hypothetical protein